MTQSSSAKAIFLAASDIADAAQRAKYLESACGGDLRLRERVEQLLQARAQTADFLTETTDEVKAAVGERIGYFGDYVLLDELARGASGVVFRARQSSLDRVVALKMLRGHGLMEGDDGLRRFKAEAQAAAGLKHANLVPIYEVGEFEGQGYYSMPLIEGGTLISRAAEFRDPRKAVALIVKVARAIHAAHEHGLLHRDIKPGNILIDAEGEPQVTDFGIARKMGLDSDLTVTGQIMGTPYYMSPEQARGETQSLTAAADVYGIGAVLYELLTTEKPFSGKNTIEVLKKVAEEPPKAPRGIERDLGVIVMKCLEKAPCARYATAAALADDLEKWLRGEPISARPAGRVERVVKWVRRSPYKAALMALGAVCLALAAWVVFEPEPPFHPGQDYVKVELGQPLDVLAAMQAPLDGFGFWKKEEDVLMSIPSEEAAKEGRRSAVRVPVHVTGDYDLHVEFMVPGEGWIKGGEGPLIVLSAGAQKFQLVFCMWVGCTCQACTLGGLGEPIASTSDFDHPIGPVSGLTMVQGEGPVTNGTGFFRHRLRKNYPHTLDVRVRLRGESASVQADFNGNPRIDWCGPITDLTQPAGATLLARESSFLWTSGFGMETHCLAFTLTPQTGDAWVRRAAAK